MDKLLTLIRQAEEKGLDLSTPITLTLLEAKAVALALESQEREILSFERRHETLKEKVDTLVTALSCFIFEQEIPDVDLDGEVFEVFVGTVSDCGRVFGLWDASEGMFYEPGDGPQTYIENVIYWRHSLPEPHEALDLED